MRKAQTRRAKKGRDVSGEEGTDASGEEGTEDRLFKGGLVGHRNACCVLPLVVIFFGRGIFFFENLFFFFAILVLLATFAKISTC